MNILTIRASSFASLIDCASRWAAMHLEGKFMPGTFPAHLGNAIHHGSAVFDQGRLDGAGVTADDAAGEFVDYLRAPSDDLVRSVDDMPMREAERVGIKLLTNYCNNIAPARRYVAVEAKCEPVRIDCGNGVVIELTGTLDRMRIDPDDQLGISDVKSGARRIYRGEVMTAADAAQIGVYEIIGEAKAGRPITAPGEIIAMQTKNGGEVLAAPVRNTRGVLIGSPGQPGLLQYAATLYERDLFIGNPKSSLCSERYCPRHSECRWRG